VKRALPSCREGGTTHEAGGGVGMAKKFSGTINLDVRDLVSDWDALTRD
jgi:hypothetical protein